MRRFFPLFLSLTLLLGCLGGCAAASTPQDSRQDLSVQAAPESASQDTQDAAQSTQPLQSIGIAYQPTGGLHPYLSQSVTNQAIFSLLYEGLFLVGSDFTAYPVLCESSAVSEDLKSWYFTLRQDVTFSDGSALTAADAAASLQSASQSPLYKTRFECVNSIEADGSYGLVILLSEPRQLLPLLLDVPILKASTLSDQTPLGTGPYYYNGTGLSRSAAWWQNATPVVDVESISFVAVDDPKSVRDAFEFGGADIVYTDPSASTVSDYHCDNECWSSGTTVMQYIGFNCTGNYCYSSTLRAGITYAVDRSTILSQYYSGFGLAASLPCSPLAPFYDNALAANYAYNPGSFQACLSASGIVSSSDTPVRMIVCSNSQKRVDAARHIAAELTQLGLHTEVAGRSESEFQSDLASGNYDLYLAEVRLPTNFDLSCFFSSTGSASYGGVADANALELNRRALENSGNYYDLFRTVMNRGLICPILFKVNALYGTRGVISAHTPAVSNLFALQPEKTAEGILSQTPYTPVQPAGDTADPQQPSDQPEDAAQDSQTPDTPAGDPSADPSSDPYALEG